MKKGFVTLIVFLALLTGSVFMTPKMASADVAANCDGTNYFLGFPTWYRYMDIGPGTPDENGEPICQIIGPGEIIHNDGRDIIVEIDWEAAISRIALAVVEILTRLGALISVGYVMYGGFRYITSQGEPDNAKSARQTIINALIGLVISLIATASVVFIAGQFT